MINFVIDTNVILRHFDEILKTKKDCGIIVPLIVLEELDKLKKAEGETAYFARSVIRKLFEIKENGNLNQWINLDNNISIKVESQLSGNPNLPLKCNDDYIISCADYCKIYGEVIFLTNDINACLKAESLGIKTEQSNANTKQDFYTGHKEIIIDDSLINSIYEKNYLDQSCLFLEEEPIPNMCVTFISANDYKKQVLTIFRNNMFERVIVGEEEIFGYKGKNRQQKYLMELLMDDNIQIIAVNSEAGTGKSFCTMLVALEKVLEQKKYEKILYVKPLVAMGKEDIGYLPSSKEDKLLDGYSGTLVNILENVFEKRDSKYSKFSYAKDLMEKGYLQIEAPTFMRGMSYPNTFIIIDEASNISKSDIKNICTRCGEGSKIVLLGDSKQVDNIKLTIYENGLQHVIERLKGQKLFGTIRLDKSVRSSVAQICVDLL